MAKSLEFQNSRRRNIEIFTDILLNIVSNNEKNHRNSESIFDAKVKKGFTFNEYVSRFAKESKISSFQLVYSLAIMDRFCNASFLPLTKKNCFKIFLISSIVVLKFTLDDVLDDKLYCKIGGLELYEYSLLEAEFLDKIAFSMVVKHDLLRQYAQPFMNKRKSE